MKRTTRIVAAFVAVFAAMMAFAANAFAAAPCVGAFYEPEIPDLFRND